MTAEEFYKSHLGRGVDIDAAYGVQCVDLFKAFTKENYNIYNYNCGNGWASGLWINRKSRPYYDKFVEVSVNEMQNGDWVIWNNGSKSCPDSHVAMYYNGKFFGQNQGGKAAASLCNLSLDGVLGVLRPKMYVKAAPKKKSVDTIAKEVINGKWGNGSERRRRLEEAGYNYTEVQAKVNQILYGAKPVLKSTEEVAKEVIRGDWGNGAERKKRLTAAGYNYKKVQDKVNELLNG